MMETDSQDSQNSAIILVVDDDASGRRLLQIILERAGYAVRQAQSGEEALAMIALSPPDLIILDDVLPGIWGDEVCARLKDNPATRAIKVLMHTGRIDKMEHYRQRDDLAGALPKPSHPNIILNTIKTALES